MSLCPHGYTLNWDCPLCEQPMCYLTISKESLARLQAQSRFPLGGVTGCSDGRFQIAVDAEVFARLEALDPDPDVAIARLCGGQWGRA